MRTVFLTPGPYFEKDREELLLIQDVEHRLSDLLAWAADTLMPRGEVLKHDTGLETVCKLIAERALGLRPPR